MFGHKKQMEVPDDNQKEYREYFKIVDKVLVYYEKNDAKTDADDAEKDGYIVFINMQNDIDYVDYRKKTDWTLDEKKEFQSCLGKIQTAEVTPCLNLPWEQVLAFKQILAQGYLKIMQRDFSGIDEIIEDALLFLKQRNLEASRQLFIESAGFVALVAAVTGLTLYYSDFKNLWIYGILFGILGSFVSIWTRYGKEDMTGLALKSLHVMESISRLFIGAIAAVVIMFAIRSGLMLTVTEGPNMFFFYCVFGFAAGFSERFLPSLIEKIITKELEK